jgi:RHS repeat-associated protein
VRNRWYPAANREVPIDGNGNLLGDGRQWDARDRLVSGGYGYDTGNLRVKMGEQKVLLDGIEEAREYGADVRYEHDPSRVDGLLAQKSGAGKGYFVTDALGSVYAVVDASGAVVSKYGYDVYGARTAGTEGMATAWGFTGRRHDGQAEMYYRERYVQASEGGFLSSDPVGRMHGAFGLYGYAMDRPTLLSDWSGQWSIAPEGAWAGPFEVGKRGGAYANGVELVGFPAELSGRAEQALRLASYAIQQPACMHAIMGDGPGCEAAFERKKNDTTFFYWVMTDRQSRTMGDRPGSRTGGATIWEEAGINVNTWVALTPDLLT